MVRSDSSYALSHQQQLLSTNPRLSSVTSSLLLTRTIETSIRQIYLPMVSGEANGQLRTGLTDSLVLTPYLTETAILTLTPSSTLVGLTAVATTPTTPTSLPTSTYSATVFITPTPIPSPTSSPTVTAIQTSENGTVELPPTSTMTPAPTNMPIEIQCINALTDAHPYTQQQTIEANLACTEPFMDLLLSAPDEYLETYYTLISSTTATDSLWTATYNRLRRGQFRFSSGQAIESLWDNLPQAIDGCQNAYRCQDWVNFILPNLAYGAMYRCPTLVALSPQEILLSVPYGDYQCIEETARYLTTIIDQPTASQLIEMGSTQRHHWSRRNVIRVLGRLVSQPLETPPHILIKETLGNDVATLLTDRLQNEASPDVLHDVIWVLDSYFFPFLSSQPYLIAISTDPTIEPNLRLRAMLAQSRIIHQKMQLDENDQRFLEASLASNEGGIRSAAAYMLQVMEPLLRGALQRQVITSSLQLAFEQEEVLSTRASLAKALDRYNGTQLHEELQNAYVAEHLSNQLSLNHVTIRSGLPQNELPAFMTRIGHTESAFFEQLGTPFDTPLPNDPNQDINLILFATRDAYRTYMDAFVGYGSHAGGLYLEGLATLYTYQREASESLYTVEHLVQHEYTHYLQGRYIFPGIWTEAGYHQEPKGWIDEGTAEFFGFAEFAPDGTATYRLPSTRLTNICPVNGTGSQADNSSQPDTGSSHQYRRLSNLLAQRAGYDQPGTFDYDYAWAFVHYLMTEQEAIIHKLLLALRENRYQLANFTSLAEVSLSTLEVEWYQAMDQWCQEASSQIQAAAEESLGGLEVLYTIGEVEAFGQVVQIDEIERIDGSSIASTGERIPKPQPPAQDPQRQVEQTAQIIRLILQ